MEVILLEKVENLGAMGDKVTVKAGFGRNYLIPQRKAKLATAENLAEFEKLRAELEAKAKAELDTATARAEQLSKLTLEIGANAGEEGKLFGSVGTADIAKACTDAGVPVDRKEVRLKDGAIRELGEFTVGLHLHVDVDVEVPVKVVREAV
ncbi:MAG: 50S ribosomal protein L9 [Gammaproteobacteria bacterium]|nr:50S ribosomal protein L9 [Gammaproteobacteria bacterium]NNC96999.1 50S ribosomal protein L9 [Gammaproteobacteria bacterium]NNM13082.1 50S ribosomal protein L9 [Gammaproteobacteria bacterium]